MRCKYCKQIIRAGRYFSEHERMCKIWKKEYGQDLNEIRHAEDKGI